MITEGNRATDVLVIAWCERERDVETDCHCGLLISFVSLRSGGVGGKSVVILMSGKVWG